MGRNFFFSLRYLGLRGSRGYPIALHDAIAVLAISAVCSLPFVFISGANYFHKDGFLDKFGTFSSVLTGFYVAGLVAVATFSMQSSALDQKIENGAVNILERDPNSENKDLVARGLTRRQYLCYMFGYMAALSMFVTLISIIFVEIGEAVKIGSEISISESRYIPTRLVRGAIIAFLSITISHLIVTTARGLYYLIDRIYDKDTELLPKRD